MRFIGKLQAKVAQEIDLIAISLRTVCTIMWKLTFSHFELANPLLLSHEKLFVF